MAYIKNKPGVDMTGLAPEIWSKAVEIAEAFDRLGYECIITAARRPPRGKFSYRQMGQALDFQAKHIGNDAHRSKILTEIIGVCGPDYDMILHGQGPNIHYHIEHDPE